MNGKEISPDRCFSFDSVYRTRRFDVVPFRVVLTMFVDNDKRAGIAHSLTACVAHSTAP